MVIYSLFVFSRLDDASWFQWPTLSAFLTDGIFLVAGGQSYIKGMQWGGGEEELMQ